MTPRPWRGRMTRALAAVVAVGVIPATALAQSGSPDAASADAGLGASDTGRWIVRFEEPSLAAYTGGIDGLQATSPQVTGEPELDVAAPAAQAYLAHLEQRHGEFAARAHRALDREVTVEREYRAVLNAVAVEADHQEAGRLADLPGVAAVYPEKLRELTTDVSHDTIGSPAIWAGDTGAGVGTRGEGVVVGVLDSGINPGHASFAAVDGDGYQHQNPLGSGEYLGVCDPADQTQPDEDICNDKLIGAWAFDYRSFSAVDGDGHGSHTASTAAGNVHEATFPVGDGQFTRTVSGVAPRANVIAYRVCVADCPTTAILAGIDQAVIDGVDVLNYSISGSDSPWQDPVELAFLDAFNAGVFVAAAAGNEGPGASTVAHTGPWTTAVAASTTNRAFAQTVDVVSPTPPEALTGIAAVPGDGGPAVTEVIEAPIRAAGVIDDGNANACAPFPTGVFTGAVALVERGECNFSVKVAYAAAAGAVAVIVYNNAAGPASTMGGLEGTAVPAVMIDQARGAALLEFVSGATDPVTVRLDPATALIVDDSWANVMADFSSRGPSRLDLVAPTITAPGVNILAAGAGDADRYVLMQGTSMASPHVAGAGALMTALHPDWTPAQIRSALASTADPNTLVSGDGSTPAGVFDQGSGLLDLQAAGRAGLVLDETYDNFRDADPSPSVGGDPKTLNLPAMVDRSCAAACSWTRTVTSVADTTATYTAQVAAPEGVTVTADPATVTLAPGESRSIEFTATVAGRPAGEWVHAAVTLTTGDTHPGGAAIADARFPVAVIPAAPDLTLEPGALAVTQEAGERTDHHVTIGNAGGQDLTWSVTNGTVGRGLTLRPTRGTTPVTVAAQPDGSTTTGPMAPERNPLAPASATGSPRPPTTQDLPDGSVTLTHSTSQDIVENNTVACSSQGLTADNGFLRTFSLADFAVFSDFVVTEVSFGVEAVNIGPSTVTVRLYTLDAEPFVYDNMTEIGSASVTLQPQALQMVSVPVSGLAPEGSTLVVEIDAPDTRTTSGFFAGSNAAGESAPSYIRSATCGMPEPTAMATAGFPDTHLVMNVTGVADAPDTQLPDWVEVQPMSGTVAAGQTQDVTVTFDSTGMAPGEHTASLLLESNDPDRRFTIVPLTLTVTGDGGDPGEPGPVSEEIIATVPAGSDDGSLVISVNPDDRTVQLPEMTSAGDRLTTSGDLRPVTVTDSRIVDPGWDVSAQVSAFASSTSSFGGGFLGWSPSVGSVSDGQTVVAGSPVGPGFPTGDGLSVPRVLASAPAGSGLGTAVLGAGLGLQVPVDTAPGVYTGVLTITAL